MNSLRSSKELTDVYRYQGRLDALDALFRDIDAIKNYINDK